MCFREKLILLLFYYISSAHLKLTRIVFESLEARMDGIFTQESHGDSSEIFRRTGKTNLQKEDTRSETMGFCY